jgi:multimeric flavodoxin WrbA
MVKEMITSEYPATEVQILGLLQYDVRPCRGCGKCFHVGRCPDDEGFNEIYAAMEAADGIVIVTPHYAMAPAKLVILLEKIQEKGYLLWLGKQPDRFALPHKPVAIVGHGGSTSDFEQLYRRNLLDSIGHALGVMGLTIVGAGEDWNNGVIFGLKATEQTDDPLQQAMIHEWDEVKQIVTPLIQNLMKIVLESTKS